MRNTFNIYPALFILTPVLQEETIQTNCTPSGNETESNFEREGNFKSYPQTFWGDCLFNENHTQFILLCNNYRNAGQVQQFLTGKFNVLNPSKFKGNRYAITYIPVLN